MIEVVDREERIRRMFPLVKRIARRVKRMVPGFDVEDLIGDGSVGLIRAVDSYDPTRGPTAAQYARRLIA
ncbi:MAG TPA: sigma factor, partial [Candidatus Acidoferrum sp.]|nr:sigma factor [Candidatus Acidoferrum sp.]